MSQESHSLHVSFATHAQVRLLLKLYTCMSKDPQAWITQSKVVYNQTEEEVAKLTPESITEDSQANKEGQEQLLASSFEKVAIRTTRYCPKTRTPQ